MAVLLAVLIGGISYFYLTATGQKDRLLLAIVAGAAGSVLSRAIKLGKQSLHVETGTQAPDPPLGIRALLAGLNVFFAQRASLSRSF